MICAVGQVAVAVVLDLEMLKSLRRKRRFLCVFSVRNQHSDRGLVKTATFLGCTHVVCLTYNPAHTKMPVSTPFCEAVVRSRQSRGIGFVAVSVLQLQVACSGPNDIQAL